MVLFHGYVSLPEGIYIIMKGHPELDMIPSQTIATLELGRCSWVHFFLPPFFFLAFFFSSLYLSMGPFSPFLGSFFSADPCTVDVLVGFPRFPINLGTLMNHWGSSYQEGVASTCSLKPMVFVGLLDEERRLPWAAQTLGGVLLIKQAIKCRLVVFTYQQISLVETSHFLGFSTRNVTCKKGRHDSSTRRCNYWECSQE